MPGSGLIAWSAVASVLAARSILRSSALSLSTHVGGWKDFDLCGILASELGLPIIMDNDANVGALGEYHFGAGNPVTRCST